jgi:beta-lactamase regulating signal transducer with metallopeptidase domain/protocatechuate 3,4-dioxygenase beta subunit/uncharacterized GH25 family protein
LETLVMAAITGVSLSWFNNLGEGFCQFAWVMMAQVGVLVAFLLLLDLVLKNKVRAVVRYWLWSLVLVKLLLPIDLKTPLSIAYWVPQLSANLSAGDAEVAQSAPRRVIDAAAVVRSNPDLVNVTSTPVADLDSRARAPLHTSTVESGPRADGNVVPGESIHTSAIIFVAWFGTVAVLFAVVWQRALKVRRLVNDADEAPAELESLFAECQTPAERARRKTCLRISDQLGSPAISGFWRATILFPSRLIDQLDDQQLRLVFDHELAHWRRGDLQVHALQTVLQILYFYNPAVWIANAAIGRLREQAVDETVLATRRNEADRYGATLLDIAASMFQPVESMVRLIGVVESRKALAGRIRRLVSLPIPRTAKLGVAGLLSIVLAGIALLPMAGGRWAASAEPIAAADGKEQPKATEKQQFELLVVGPDGKPIPEAIVKIQSDPPLKAEQFLEGKFVKKARAGIRATTDSEGRLKLAFAAKPKWLSADITTPGYGPYLAEWSSHEHSEEIPPSFTAELDAGWSVGGIVVDGQGNPVAGVEIEPGIVVKKRPGDLQELWLGPTTKTDAAGKWRFDSVPASKRDIPIGFHHKSFQPEHQNLTRTDFGLELAQAPTAKFRLSPGLRVTGKVTDEAGKPIAGAILRTQLGGHSNREAKTGEDGTYQIVGCMAQADTIVVSAKGRATDLRQIRIEEGMAPVDFQMQPGGKVRIRVVDENGKGLAKARIFFQNWRGEFAYFTLKHVNQYADKNGVWEWNEAPIDAFYADICPPGGRQISGQSIIARDEEYVFQRAPVLEITGMVVDDETKEPIKKFNVVPGSRYQQQETYWIRSETFESTQGKFSLRRNTERGPYLVRIEADGYLSAESRTIYVNEGKVAVRFDLKKGESVATSITTPDGAPAAKARVALGVAGSQIRNRNGEIDPGQLVNAIHAVADADGKVKFPPQTEPFYLVVTHPAGYARVQVTLDTIPKTIKLEPWATVEGTFRIGKNPAPNVRLTLIPEARGFHESGVLQIYSSYHTTTDKNGRYRFDRVLPGRARIGREVYMMANRGALEIASARLDWIDLTGGKTAKIELGGTGRPVTGRLALPEDFAGKVDWNFASIRIVPHAPTPPAVAPPQVPDEIRNDQAKLQQFVQDWENSPAGLAWKAWGIAAAANQRIMANNPELTVMVAADGSFRIDDTPAGPYALSVSFIEQRGPAGLKMENLEFRVPDMEGDRSDEAFDLGVLIFK